jgi:hypothetical protein
MSLDRTPMKVRIIHGTDFEELQLRVNEFLETENLDTYNVIDNVVGEELSFTILHRIKEPLTEEELEARVTEKLEIEAQRVEKA